MRVDVFTIFPGYFDSPLSASLLGRARERGLLDIRLHDPRDWTTDRHRAVDDTPFGGGAGMVMMPEPLFAAVEAVEPPRPLFLLSAAGRPFDQAVAGELAAPRGLLAPLRALRGRRPAGRRPPLRRRALRRRLRPGRRGGGRAGGHRGGRPAPPRGHGERGVGRGGVLRRRAGRVPPVHPARPASGASRCRRSSAPATMAGSPAGATPKPSAGPGTAGPTCSSAGACRTPSGRCWRMERG